MNAASTTGRARAAGVDRILGVCCDLRAGERLAILADSDERRAVAELLAARAAEIGAVVTLLDVDETQTMPDTAPENFPAGALDHELLIGVTGRSMYHAALGKRAAAGGSRVLALTQCRLDSLASSALTADFAGLAPVARRFADRLGDAEQVRLTTASGTDLVASVAGRDGFACTGLALKPGDRNGCPDIESYIAPEEVSINGIVVVDASSTPFGLLSEPVTIEVERGLARSFSGGDEGRRLLSYLRQQGTGAMQFAEFGFGLSPVCRVIGQIVEDEGTYGTGHVAFGSNDGFGGNNSAGAHVDLVYWAPTLALDGEVVVDSGALVWDREFASRHKPTVRADRG